MKAVRNGCPDVGLSDGLENGENDVWHIFVTRGAKNPVVAGEITYEPADAGALMRKSGFRRAGQPCGCA